MNQRAGAEGLNQRASNHSLKGLLLLQEYEERTDKVRKLKEEFANASSGLQTLTAAVEKKKVREINAVML